MHNIHISIPAINYKIQEIRSGREPLVSDDRRIAVYVATTPRGPHVGWHYAPANTIPGDRFRFDHGTADDNRDGIYVWVAPEQRDQIRPGHEVTEYTVEDMLKRVAVAESTTYEGGLVDEAQLRKAIDHLPRYGESGTSVSWVNWRKDQYQIRMVWKGAPSLVCYLNFFSASERDRVLYGMFQRYAGSGAKPWIEQGHGWTKPRYDFRTTQIITINEAAKVADELGAKYTVIYVAECCSYRHLFDLMGIPLIPGQMGKELIDGQLQPYCQDPNGNL